jgi:hypothetical protein
LAALKLSNCETDSLAIWALNFCGIQKNSSELQYYMFIGVVKIPAGKVLDWGTGKNLQKLANVCLYRK